MVIEDCTFKRHQPLDLSGALWSNRSLKELALNNFSDEDPMTISPQMIQEIPLLLGTNKRIQMIKLWNISMDSDMILPIPQAVESYPSLSTVELRNVRLEYDAVEAIGNMLQNASSLRILALVR